MIQHVCNIGSEYNVDAFNKVAVFEATQLIKFNNLTADVAIKQILDTVPNTHQVLITDLLPDNIRVSNPVLINGTGSRYSTNVSFVITPQDKNLQGLLNSYQNKEVVLLVSKRGVSHLYGTSAQPLLFSFSELNNPTHGKLKGYNVTVSGVSYGAAKLFEHLNFTIYQKGLAFGLAQEL